MKNRSILLIAAVAMLAFSCKPKGEVVTFIMSPSANYSERDGKPINVKVSYPASYSPDSVVYFLDGVYVGSKKDSSAVTIKTDTLRCGSRVITANIYKGGKSQAVKTNIIIMPTRMPTRYRFKLIKKFPHDTTAFTEGLSYQDGYLYESTGGLGHSEIRKVELETGKIVQRQKLDDKYTGTGSAVIGDKIVMFTQKDKAGFVFDKNTLKQVKQFTYLDSVAWGATTDGKNIYVGNSTNRVWLLDPNDYHKTGSIEIYDHEAPVNQIGELEYIDGKIYANIFDYDTMLIINGKTGAVEKAISFMELWPGKERPKKFEGDKNVFNGIAWDAKGKRLFVTGKKWPFVYQVELVKATMEEAQH